MGDYYNGSITIGGKLPRSKIMELCAAVGAEGAGFDWGVEDANAEAVAALVESADFDGELSVYANDALNGSFEDLEDTCRDLGLAYCRHSDACGEAEAETVYWRPGMGEPEAVGADNEGHLMIPVDSVRDAIKGDDVGLRRRLDALLAPYDTTIPKLEIVADQ
jgi:hypothetical protein